MLRPLTYIVFGWLLIAAVGGLAHAFSLSLMLPATSAVLVAHMAFSRQTAAPLGLGLAIALGYLEDLHQGAPVGTLALAHGLAFLALRWASGRVALPGWLSRAVAALVAVVVIDTLTWAILLLLADALSLRAETVTGGLSQMRWHGLATLIAAPPVWALLDRMLSFSRSGERVPAYRGHR